MQCLQCLPNTLKLTFMTDSINQYLSDIHSIMWHAINGWMKFWITTKIWHVKCIRLSIANDALRNGRWSEHCLNENMYMTASEWNQHLSVPHNTMQKFSTERFIRGITFHHRFLVSLKHLFLFPNPFVSLSELGSIFYLVQYKCIHILLFLCFHYMFTVHF